MSNKDRVWAKIGFRVVGIALGLGVALALSEALFRLTSLGETSFFQPDPVVGYTHIPNQSGWVHNNSEGTSLKVKINSHGLRDDEHSWRKPPGVKRVLILGDSYPEGFQVRLDETFHQVLERTSNRNSASARVEVINTGHSGYGTDNELLYYRNYGRKYSPDLVVLAFVLNDVRDNSYAMVKQDKGHVVEPYFTLEDGSLKLQNYPCATNLSGISSKISRHFRTYYFIRKSLKFKKFAKRAVEKKYGWPSIVNIYRPEYDEQWKEAWDVTRALLHQVREEVEADGARFMIMGVTASIQVHPEHRAWYMDRFTSMKDQVWDWDKPHRILEAICRDENIPYLNLLPAFRREAQVSGKSLHFRGGHWNSLGHSVAGKLLWGFISREGLI